MPQTLFAGAVCIAFGYGLYDAAQQSFLGGVFTGGLSALMLVLSLIVFFKLLTNSVDDPVNFDNEYEAGYVGDRSVASLPHYIYWLVALIAGCYMVGYLIAISAFFVAFLLVKARTSAFKTTALTSIAVGFLVTLSHVMVLDLPQGLLQEMMTLPWPLG